ncbi:hypothetical protein [Nonlabens agnitus]|uniref:hypothetical protein n=1 Tax=Nonlabens agnitus TaxID=870484 RepID=UPI001F5BB025|nr:hypothetical protein [Nonlabens agnitus]
MNGKSGSGNCTGNEKLDAIYLDRFSASIYRIGFNKTLKRQLLYAPVVNMCIDIRKAILRYEGKESGDDDT